MDKHISNHLYSRADPNAGCTTSTCPASESVYGYAPNLAATIVFLVIFAISGLSHIAQGYLTRTWVFSNAMAIGCLAQTLGYIAKVILHYDPFSDVGFKMSIVVLTFAPAFYAAGIYYTLKHICLSFGANLSRLPPAYYTYIFIGCDIFSILLQAAGGAVASISEDMSTLKIGDNIMITGLVTQVATMLAFAALAADYGFAVRRNGVAIEIQKKFKMFLVALCVSYCCILIRCAYRVAELSKGWGPDNDILRNEGLFIGLDSVTCGIASVVLNIWHPGRCFPKQIREEQEMEMEKNASMPSARADGNDLTGPLDGESGTELVQKSAME